MRVLSLWILVFLSWSVTAQEKRMPQPPDYKSIEKITKDNASDLYYPTLLKRYLNDDTTLTAKDYHYIYYGYFFNEAYNAIGDVSSFRDSIKVLNNKKVWLAEDKKSYLKYNLELLKGSPLQPSLLIGVYAAYKELNDEQHAELYRQKCRAILETILATGDGLTCGTGYHVLTVSDEYSILRYLGYKFGESQSLTADECDYLKLQDNDDHIKGLYFDVKQLFKGYYKMFEGSDMGKDNKAKKK